MQGQAGNDEVEPGVAVDFVHVRTAFEHAISDPGVEPLPEFELHSREHVLGPALGHAERVAVDTAGNESASQSPSLAVTSTRQPASMMRSRSESAEKPAKTTEWAAPIRAQASMV